MKQDNISLEAIFSGFDKLRVLIIGDVMIDSYLWGKVERISPEAPVPIVHVQKREKRLGGAANVALNVQSLGGTPILCAVIGDDSDGRDFLELLDNGHLVKEGIIQSKERITTIKHRVISGSQQMLRIDSEVDSLINKTERDSLVSKAKELIPTCDVVIFEDYDKGVLSAEAIKEIIDFANAHNKPTVVDPKKRNFLHYHNATLFKPNLKELKEGLKLDFDGGKLLDNVKEGVTQLKEKLGINIAFITLSEYGVYIDGGSENQYHISAHKREIADVSGAGDTVISVAAMTLALGLSADVIAGLSNLAGGIVCEHVGVVPIRKDDLFTEAQRVGIL